MAHASPGYAQQHERPAEASSEVTPRGGAKVIAEPSDVSFLIFRVHNTGEESAAYDLKCDVNGRIKDCRVLGPQRIEVGAGDQAKVTVAYRTRNNGAGKVQLIASNDAGQARGEYDVKVEVINRRDPATGLEANEFSGLLSLDGTGLNGPSARSEFRLMSMWEDVARGAVYPAGGTFSTATLDVLFLWCYPDGPNYIYPSTRNIKFNGSDVTSNFTYNPYYYDAVPPGCTSAPPVIASTGTVSLAVGYDSIKAIMPTYDVAYSDFLYDTVTATYIRSANVAPIVNVTRYNPGPRLDRASCLTVGAGEAGAFQCGDIMMTHAMPTYRSNDHDRNLTLLYNSRTSRPIDYIMLDVAQPFNAAAPTSVQTVLTLTAPGPITYTWTHTYAYDGFSVGAEFPYSRFLSLPVNADSLGLPTGVYAYTVQVSNVYSGGNQTTTVSGELVVLDRQSSAYGNGWGLIGERRLYPQTVDGVSKLLLVDGDASAFVFTGANDSTWVAPTGAGYQDTIMKKSYTDGSYVSGTYYRLKTLDRVSYYFDIGQNGPAQKHLRYIVDAAGNTSAYTWTSDTTAVSRIGVAPRADSLIYKFSYTSSKLDSITDPAGRILQVGHTGNQLTWFQDPGYTSGTRVSFEYDGSDRLTKRTDRRGYATSYVYGSTMETILPDSEHIKYYPIQQRALPKGAIDTTVSTWDARIKVDGARMSVGDTAEFWPNRYGSPVQIIDPAGAYQWLTYAPAADNLLWLWHHDDGRKRIANRDAFGRVTSSVQTTWKEGVNTIGVDTTIYEYSDADAPSSPSRVRQKMSVSAPWYGLQAQWDTTRTSYNSAGLPDTVIDATGHKTALFYTNGKLTRIKDLAVNFIRSGSEVTDSLVTTLAYSSDKPRNLISVTTPGGKTSTLRRDNAGRVTTSINAANDSVSIFYNSRDLQQKMMRFDTTDAGAASMDSVLFAYDDAGNLTLRTDQRGHTRAWVYDKLNRDTAAIDEYGHRDRFAYAADGVLSKYINRRGDTITYTFDARGLETQRVLRNIGMVADSLKTQTITTHYDIAGRPDTLQNSFGALLNRVYYIEGLLKSEVLSMTLGPSGFGESQQYEYDVSGRRSMKSFSGGWPLMDVALYFYGHGSRLRAIGWGGYYSTPVDTVKIGRDSLGRRTRLDYRIYGAGTTPYATYGYDADGNMVEIASADTATRVHLKYTFDSANRLTAIDDQLGTHPLSQTNVYDRRSRLRKSVLHGDSTMLFGYDGGDNMTSQTYTALSVAFDIDSLANRAIRRSETRAGTTISWPYRYDDAGSLAKHMFRDTANALDSIPLYYNAQGQMLSHDGTTQFYRYDPDGRLSFQYITDSDGYTWPTFFAHDGPNVSTYNAYPILNGEGVDDPLLAYYDHLNPSGGRPCYFVTAGGRKLDVRDPMTTGACGDPDGNVTGAYAGATTDSYGFEQQKGGSYQMSSFRNRWYDSQLARFTQEDPIGYAGDLNLYAYAGNNPTSYSDPFGLQMVYGPNPLQHLFRSIGSRLRNWCEAIFFACGRKFEGPDKINPPIEPTHGEHDIRPALDNKDEPPYTIAPPGLGLPGDDDMNFWGGMQFNSFDLLGSTLLMGMGIDLGIDFSLIGIGLLLIPL
jgi:RHS repeat-associated protein